MKEPVVLPGTVWHEGDPEKLGNKKKLGVFSNQKIKTAIQ